MCLVIWNWFSNWSRVYFGFGMREHLYYKQTLFYKILDKLIEVSETLKTLKSAFADDLTNRKDSQLNEKSAASYTM